jgi:hypothetical protein
LGTKGVAGAVRIALVEFVLRQTRVLLISAHVEGEHWGFWGGAGEERSSVEADK